MSNEALSGLDELFDYKNQLMEDLLTDERLVAMVTDDEEVLAAPERLMYTQVFPYEYVPETIEHGQTYICCDVDIRSVVNKTYLRPVLYVWIFTHKSKLRLPEGGVRIDRIASRVSELINGSRKYGLGELELSACERFTPVMDYQGRVLIFYATDYNRVAQTPQRPPVNRKR